MSLDAETLDAATRRRPRLTLYVLDRSLACELALDHVREAVAAFGHGEITLAVRNLSKVSAQDRTDADRVISTVPVLELRWTGEPRYLVGDRSPAAVLAFLADAGLVP